MQIDQYLLA